MTISRRDTQGRDQQILAGIEEDLQSMPSFPLGGTIYTPATLAAFIQSRIDAANQIVTARAAWLDAVKAYQALDARGAVIVADLRNVLIAAFGRESPKLAHFGLVAPRRPTLTPEAKVAAAKRRKATRKARRTLGKKQKLEITGASVPAASAPTAG